MLRNIILISALVSITYTLTAADEPILPWYEKYLFPIGSWTSPQNDGTIKPWLTANNIDIWEPQDCSTFTDIGLDFARFRPLFGAPSPSKTTDYNDNGVPDRIETAGKIADWIKPYGARLYWRDEYVFTLLDSDNFVPDWGDPGNENNPPYDEHACWPNYECDGQCMEDPPDRPLRPAYPPEYPEPNPFTDCDEYITNKIDADIKECVFTDYSDAGKMNYFEFAPSKPNFLYVETIDEPWIFDFRATARGVHFFNDPAWGARRVAFLGHVANRTRYKYGASWGRTPDSVTNYLWYEQCQAQQEILCSCHYPCHWVNPANSLDLYKGWPWYNNGTFLQYKFGFELHYLHLLEGREAALRYDTPFWHVPQAEGLESCSLPRDHRIPTPREIRAQVNMALTCGAKGIIHFIIYESQNAEFEAVYDAFGNPNTGTYLTYKDTTSDEDRIAIPWSSLRDEIREINTKLHSVRDTLQTLTSLDAFHSFNLSGSLPRGLIYDYEGNRNDRQWYSPDYTEETDYLDFGTFVCPYTGVRYFAVSDRFCNWPPATYPDPSEEDEITVRHPGRVIYDIYDDDPNPRYVTFFNIDNNHHGNGTSTFDVDLRNADGRIFKLDPCLNYNPGFEDDEHPYAPPNDWTLYDGEGFTGGFEITDETARKGDWSLKIYDLYETADFLLDNDVVLDIDSDVFAGMTYRLSGYVKCSPNSPSIVLLEVIKGNTPPKVAGAVTLNACTDWAGPDGWVYTSDDFEMPEREGHGDYVRTRIHVYGGNPTNSVWVDEVRLEPSSRVFNGHFEYDVGDWWIGPVHGWGYNGPAPQGGWGYERSTPGKYGDYCLKVTGKTGKDNVVRNDEKLYLGKGTNYAVTGWARRGLTVPGVNAKVVVEFYASNGDMFKEKTYIVPTGGAWQKFNISVTPGDWEGQFPIAPNTKPAYVRIICKMEAGAGDAYFDNIELIETNLIANGSFELAEEGPHWPDEWHYTLAPIVPPGDPAWSALYDADARYDRRCWRVRGPATGSVKYSSDTFPLYANTSYRLSGWMRSFDVDNRIDEGCYLKLDFYDVSGNAVDSYETDIVASEEDWTYKYVDFTPPDEGPGGEIISGFGRVTVVEEGGAYSSAADGIRVLPTGSSQ